MRTRVRMRRGDGKHRAFGAGGWLRMVDACGFLVAFVLLGEGM